MDKAGPSFDERFLLLGLDDRKYGLDTSSFVYGENRGRIECPHRDLRSSPASKMTYQQQAMHQ